MRFKHDETKMLKIKSRDAVVDNVKGLLVLLYAFVHIMRNLPYVDGFNLGAAANNLFYHSPPVAVGWWGFNVLDLAPIAFYFLIGFVMYQSFQKHYDAVGRGAYRMQFLRNLTVMGLFLLEVYIENSLVKTGSPAPWSYMVGIGFTGILTIPFLTPVFRKTGLAGALIKFGAAAAVLVVYALLHDALFGLVGGKSGHGGGAAASFGFAAVVLFAAGVKDISKLGIKAYAIASAAIYLLGLLVGKVLKVEISYDVFSAGYLFTGFTKINLIFFILYAVNKYALKDRAVPLLSAIGRNILLYILIAIVVIGALIFLKDSLPKMTFLWAFFTAVGIDGLFILLAVPLEKKKIMFKL
ncbi:MAG: hypothetical protein LBP62_02310 [Clostridiales bacterium]|jgi:hypothetical protein|nr:hypothetical protein [Clostridiales bacterium]